MKKSTLLFLTTAFVVGLLAALFLSQNPKETTPPPTPKVEEAQPSEAQPQPAPVVRLPVTPPPTDQVTAEQEKQLPALEKSDTVLREALTGILPEKNWLDMFIFDHLIRRFVLMVDSLPRPDMSYNRLPLYTPFNRFIPAEYNGALAISPKNYDRYKSFVSLVDKVEMMEAAELYFSYYPLFQEAYRELGYPDGRFNDRFIEVIDHLLATPDIQEPIRLVQPHIRYQYADPKLEALSAGQKLLIRMGNENSGAVLAKLRELRPLLVNFGPTDN
ncbi:MAG: DUF3014 domain-containing protein [Deltaproteobacteria bacterium]|nr:DUF3014 domain-containing protein [Deltaproteobacteria bacterium]